MTREEAAIFLAKRFLGGVIVGFVYGMVMNVIDKKRGVL